MTECKVEGCNSKIKQGGYCSKHYSQMYRHGRLTPEKERRVYDSNTKCEHRGCEELARKKGFCQTHYSQFVNYGKTYDKRTAKNIVKKGKGSANLYIYDKNQALVANVLIDIEDIEKIKEYEWYYDGSYIQRKNNKVSLHRFLTNASKGEVVDHINHNKLDNRKKNLRICSVAQNTRSHKGYRTNTTGKTGVYLERGRWRARITVNNKRIHLGNFDNKKDAVNAREKAEEEYFGEFKPLI